MIDRIKEIRQKIFVSQSNMEDCLNLSRNTLSAYERGKAFFKPHTLQLLCNNYKININWLLTGQGNMLLSDNEKSNTSQQLQKLQEEINKLKIENNLLKELLQSNKQQ